MSEIPYVNQLGDAFDEAIARRAHSPRRRRLGRRRYLAVALAALAVAGGGAAIAGMLHDRSRSASARSAASTART